MLPGEIVLQEFLEFLRSCCFGGDDDDDDNEHGLNYLIALVSPSEQLMRIALPILHKQVLLIFLPNDGYSWDSDVATSPNG